MSSEEKLRFVQYAMEILDREKKRLAALLAEAAAEVATPAVAPADAALKAVRNQQKAGKKLKCLNNFMKGLGYKIVSYNEKKQSSMEFYSLSKTFWKNRVVLEPLAHLISECISKKKGTFRYLTAENQPADVNLLKTSCLRLKAHGLLLDCHFNDSKREIVATLPKDNIGGNFFAGGWAEYVNVNLIDKTLKEFAKKRGVAVRMFFNVLIKRLDGESGQPFDMKLALVAQVDQRIYIFEVKSGGTLDIGKWIERAKIFETSQSRYIMCCASEKIDWRLFRPYHLFKLPTIEKQFCELLEEDFAEEK